MKNAFIFCIILSVSLLSSCAAEVCEHIYGGAELLEGGEVLRACQKCSTEVIDEPMAAELDAKSVREMLGRSVVTVIAYGEDGAEINRGSGFFIGENGVFVTNAHVIADSHRIDVVDGDGVTTAVTGILNYNYSSSDYAVCRADGLNIAPVTISEDVFVGLSVYAVGYPVSTGNLTVSGGHIASTSLVAGYKSYVSFTAEISSGFSGGVLVSGDGLAIGILTGIHYTGVSVAVPLSEISFDPSDKGAAVETFFTSSSDEP